MSRESKSNADECEGSTLPSSAMWSQDEDSFDTQLSCLKSWVAQANKEHQVGQKYVYPSQKAENEEERRLGRWAKQQREDFKRGKLNEYRETALYGTVGWSWLAKDFCWMDM